MERVLDGLEDEIEKIVSRYPTRRSAMLPVLALVQRKIGWTPEDVFPEVTKGGI